MIPIVTKYDDHIKFWFMLVTTVILSGNVHSLSPSSIYSHCSTTKTLQTPERSCVFEGKDNCLDKKNCEFILTFTRNKTTNANGVYEFEMLGYPKKRDNKIGFYMAMGISKGHIMGQDLVVSCGVDNHNPKIQNLFLQLSYNTQTKYGNDPYFSNFAKQINQLKTGEIKYENGVMLCSFFLPHKTEVQTEKFDFENEQNVIFLANGAIKVERKQGKEMIRIKYHSLTEAYLTEKLWMKEKMIWQANNDKGKEVALRLHMSFMVVAFVVLMPTSMLIARFFKESQVKKRIFHRRIWFAFHSLSLSLGLAFVLGALIVIAIEIGNFNGTKQHPHFKIHYTIGTVAVAGYVSQILMGLYMALTENHRGVAKLVLSVLHWFLGVVTYILGMIQIFLAPYSMAIFISSYCSISSIILLFWILLHMIFYFILTCLLYKSDNNKLKTTNKEIGTDVESIGSSKSSDEKTMSNKENDKNVNHKKTTGIFEDEGKTEEEFENRKLSIASKKSNKSQLVNLNNSNLITSNKTTTKQLRLKKTKHIKNKITPVQMKDQDKDGLDSTLDSKTKPKSSNKNKDKGKRKISGLENKPSSSTMEKVKEQPEKNNAGKSQISNSSSSNQRRKIVSRNNSKTFISRVESRRKSNKPHRIPSISINQFKQKQNDENNDHENKEMQLDDEKDKDSIDQSPVMTFLPQQKDTEIVFDEHPEYNTNTMLPVPGKHVNHQHHHHHALDKDPRRAFKSYPLKIRSVEEYPRTFVIEIFIALFFLFSILTAIFLCYTLFPNISRDPDPDGSEQNVHCEAESGTPMWMHKFP